MAPVSSYRLYGVPCAHCEQPAHHVEHYINGIRVVHMDPRKRPCDHLSPTKGEAK
jgi:hypothetical protein